MKKKQKAQKKPQIINNRFHSFNLSTRTGKGHEVNASRVDQRFNHLDFLTTNFAVVCFTNGANADTHLVDLLVSVEQVKLSFESWLP